MLQNFARKGGAGERILGLKTSGFHLPSAQIRGQADPSRMRLRARVANPHDRPGHAPDPAGPPPKVSHSLVVHLTLPWPVSPHLKQKCFFLSRHGWGHESGFRL